MWKGDGMRRRRAVGHRIASVSLMVTTWLVAAPGGAQEVPVEITKLRDKTVALYRCEDTSKPALEYSRERFLGPWKATKDPDKPMLLRVVVDGDPYCVKAYMVETRTVVPATRSGGECKTAGGKQPPRAGFTRGMGEGCKP